ncbi:hypothetical protein [Pollutimonas nitritireducens]|uniref:hypothetical protein n=1 Tax=Pollutimonas nitritireducens TaxID=2045209 RepID=UPI00117F9836|nr:hypothetical protein [Pollutimonas nitritireducens]
MSTGDSTSKAAIISGRSEQSKTISRFNPFLISSGELAAARDHGIFWHTRARFESLLSGTHDRIASRHADGELQTLVGSGEEPILRTVNEALIAIMTADLPLPVIVKLVVARWNGFMQPALRPQKGAGMAWLYFRDSDERRPPGTSRERRRSTARAYALRSQMSWTTSLASVLLSVL